MAQNNMVFDAKDDEDINEYIRRMIPLKEVYGITWGEICDNIYDNFGVALTANAAQKRAKRLSQLDRKPMDIDLELASCVEECDEEDFSADQLLKMEMCQMRDERTQVNALFRRLSREETIKDIAKDAVGSIMDIKPLRMYSCTHSLGNKEGVLLLGDWHFGIEVENNFNKFNPEVAKARVEQLRDKVVDKIRENHIGKLYILNLGDLIAGNIHLPIRINSRYDVITQIMKVSELLAELISDLSNYAEIDYYSVVDNHSRIDPNKKDALQLETLARITDWYLKERLGLELHENKYGPTIADFKTNGGIHILMVHGDKDKPNNIISRLSNFTHASIDVLCSAHLHHFAANENNGTLHVENGSLMGTDQYAYDLRLNSKPSQTLLVFDEKDLDGIFKMNLD